MVSRYRFIRTIGAMLCVLFAGCSASRPSCEYVGETGHLLAKRLEESPSEKHIVDYSDERLNNSEGDMVEQAIREAYANGSASIELHSEELCRVASELENVPTRDNPFYYIRYENTVVRVLFQIQS